MTKTKIYLECLPVNLNQGLLMDFENRIFGAYNSDKKVFVIKEGFILKDFSIPEEIKDFTYQGKAGHFTVGYWDFNKYAEIHI